MSPDATPDYVGLSFDLLFSVLKGRASIICPGHLENPLRSLYAFDAQTFSKWPMRLEVLNELPDGEIEAFPVFGRKRRVIFPKPVGLPVGRQAMGEERSVVQGVEEVGV